MNLESINKWLDEEYGCSYTRLEELHDFYFEKYTDHKKEINRLNNIINRTIKYVESLSSSGRGCDIYEDIKKEILNELKGDE